MRGQRNGWRSASSGTAWPLAGRVAIERAVAARVEAAVGFDAWCALTIDPASMLPTGGFHDNGVPHELLPRLVEIEARGEDPLAFPSLARTPDRVALSACPRGRPEASRRFQEV